MNDLETGKGAKETLQAKINRSRNIAEGLGIEIKGPEWCKENAEKARDAVLKIMLELYGFHALLVSEKGQAEFLKQIENGTARVWVFYGPNGEVAGTVCMINNGNRTVEWGRIGFSGEFRGQGLGNLTLIPILDLMGHNPENFDMIVATIRMAKRVGDIPKGNIQHVSFHGKEGESAVWNFWGVDWYYQHGDPMHREPFAIASIPLNISELIEKNKGVEIMLSEDIEDEEIEYLKQIAEFNGIGPVFVQRELEVKEDLNPVKVRLKSEGDLHVHIIPDENGEEELTEDLIVTLAETYGYINITVPSNSPHFAQMQKFAKQHKFLVTGYIPAINNHQSAGVNFGRLVQHEGVEIVPAEAVQEFGELSESINRLSEKMIENKLVIGDQPTA